jgi:hypothetical protein
MRPRSDTLYLRLTGDDQGEGPGTFPADAGGADSQAAFRIGDPQEDPDSGVVTVQINYNQAVHWPDYPPPTDWGNLLTVNFTPLTVSLQTPDASATENAQGEDADPGQFQATLSGQTRGPVDVNLDAPGGTATEGVDYENLPRQIHFSAGETIKPIDINTIDDPDDEGIETIDLSLTDGPNYFLGAEPATRAATQPVNEDDNVSVKSIAVKVASGTNASYGFNFKVAIDITGEHLDKVEIRQQINASTWEINYDGHQLSDRELADAFSTTDPNAVNSGGKYVTDTRWNWARVTVTDPGKSHDEDTQFLEVTHETARYDATTDVTISWLAGVSRYFKIETKETGKDKVLKSFDWGYKWDNSNCQWGADENPPPPKVSCTRSNKDNGIFSDIQGITRLDELN